MLCLYVIHSRRPMLRFPPQTCEKTQLYLWHLPSSPLALPRPQRAVSWVSHAIFPLSLSPAISSPQITIHCSARCAEHTVSPSVHLLHFRTVLCRPPASAVAPPPAPGSLQRCLPVGEGTLGAGSVVQLGLCHSRGAFTPLSAIAMGGAALCTLVFASSATLTHFC